MKERYILRSRKCNCEGNPGNKKKENAEGESQRKRWALLLEECVPCHFGQEQSGYNKGRDARQEQIFKGHDGGGIPFFSKREVGVVSGKKS